MKVGFVSLGCPKNQLDTEVMLHHVLAAGHEITPDETEADVVIINTCAFIESAKQEAIDNILDIAWLKQNRNLRAIIVTGCLVERYHAQMLEELPEVDAILGVGSIHDIVEALDAVCDENRTEKYVSVKDHDCVALGGDRVLTTPEYMAYLKIAEGCDNHCTYCAIPSIRGKFRSRPMDELIDEAKTLEALGVRELTIIAQDITRYGLDLYGRYALHELLHRITEQTTIPWIRLLYCYPDKMTDELIAEIRDNPRILKYVDMPLQHVSNRMLKLMNRHGDGKTVREVVAKLRREIPDLTLRTTFIVGFPGERQEDFDELCEFVKEARFDHMGAFPYSREEGTPAYSLPDQIDEQIKQDRLDVLMRMQMHINEQQNEQKIGKTVRVLVEDFDAVSEAHFGRSEADAPDIDGKVYFGSARRIAPGSFVDVRVDEVVDYDVYGTAVLPE